MCKTCLCDEHVFIRLFSRQNLLTTLMFKYPLINYFADNDCESLDSYKEEKDCQCYMDEACGLTLIHFAAMCNEIDIIIRLIKKDPMNQFESFYGYTPLYFAAEKGHLEAFKVLIEHFKIIDLSSNGTSKGWSTPLYTAAENGHADVCQLIIDKIKERHSKETAKEMLNSKPYFDNYTALHKAAIHNKPEVCNVLMKESLIDKLPRDKLRKKWTPLHYAAERGHFEVVKVMTEHLDINERNPADIFGMTPLYWAIRNDRDGNPTPSHLKICKLLIENIEDKNPIQGTPIQNTVKNTLLHIAAEDGHVEICKMILEDISVKNPVNRYGETPLHLAAFKGHVEICKMVLECISDKNPVDKHGETPLHLAASNGHLEICQMITDKIEKVNPADKFG